MGKLTALVGLLVVAVAIAQQPTPCKLPPAFQSRASVYDHDRNQLDRFLIAYDEVNHRKVLFEEQLVVIPGRRFFEFLTFNNENLMYTVNLREKTCTKSVPRPWRDYGIPPDATFELEYTMGGPGESFMVQDWSDRIPLKKTETWFGSFTLTNCYPVSQVTIDRENLTETSTTMFYDFVTGLPDPDIFIPPPECNNATWSEPPYYPKL
ncbi:hypothetical protein ScPMuIL_016874 [Solemya velum]